MVMDAQQAEFSRVKLALLKRTIEIDAIQRTPGTIHIEKFRSIHKGERCAILCNGESLKNFPASWPGITIGINHSWEHIASPYHCMVDASQIDTAKRAGARFNHLFVGIFNSKWMLWRDLQFETCTEVGGWGDAGIAGFSVDLARHGAWMPSTPYFAIQLAVYMGFQRLDFWGLDLKGGKFHDSGNIIDKESVCRQNAQLGMAALVLQRRGIEAFNCNPESACLAFQKISPEDL